MTARSAYGCPSVQALCDSHRMIEARLADDAGVALVPRLGADGLADGAGGAHHAVAPDCDTGASEAQVEADDGAHAGHQTDPSSWPRLASWPFGRRQ